MAVSLALTGLAITGYTAVTLIAVTFLIPLHPESLFPAAGFAVLGLTFAWAGFITARKASTVVRWIIAALVVPATLLSALVLWPALWVAAEPFYLENRRVTEDVQWKVHSHFPNRITFNFSGDRLWHTLREQTGLKEHLQRDSSGQRVRLDMTALLNSEGRVIRFSVDRIDGFELRRQYLFGHYLPKF